MKRVLVTILAALLLAAVPLRAQVITPNQSITVIDSGTACVTAPAACAIYALDQATAGVTINVFGTWTGTLTFEGTNNDGIWIALGLTTNLATGAQGSTTTANGLFAITNAGVIKVRVRATAAITGTAQITAAKGLGFARAGAGNGAVGSAPQLVGYGRSAAVTNAAVASIAAFTVGPADGTFQVTYDALILSGATFSFTVEVAFTDEGNTARVTTFNAAGSGSAGAPQFTITLTAAQGALAYAGTTYTLRAKAATTITIRTQAAGTYTAIVYNIEGAIFKLA